jgi:hypothetical protein
MGIPSFFKQNKPRGFNYMPRHYDPVKEEREARRHAMGLGQQEESGRQSGDSTEQSPIRGAFRRSMKGGSMKGYFSNRKESTRNHSTIRLAVIIIILVLVTYLYLRF